MRLGFGPQDWDLGLKAGIWALRLRYGPVVGGGTKKKEKKEKEKEKIPLCESIGHQPLWGHCPAPTLNCNHDLPEQGTGTADHLTLLRLFFLYSTVYHVAMLGNE